MYKKLFQSECTGNVLAVLYLQSLLLTMFHSVGALVIQLYIIFCVFYV